MNRILFVVSGLFLIASAPVAASARPAVVEVSAHKSPKLLPVNDQQREIKRPVQKRAPRPVKADTAQEWPQLG